MAGWWVLMLPGAHQQKHQVFLSWLFMLYGAGSDSSAKMEYMSEK